MLTNGVTHTVQIPHEAGHWMEFRQLGFTKIDSAQRARLRSALESVHELGDLSAQLATLQAQAAATPAQKTTKYDVYDKRMLLTLSLANWSYSDANGEQIPVTPEHIADLDPTTADWAFRTIVDLHHPDEDEDARKNA